MKNNIPSGWAFVRVGDVADYINGKAFKPTEWSTQGKPIIRIQNLNNPKATFNYCDFEVDEKFRVMPFDLLFAWSGTPGTSFGAHIWQGDEAVLNQHIFRVVPNDNMVDKYFLKYALNSVIGHFISKAHGGAGLAHVTKSKFEETLIPLPPLAEQKRITAQLESVLQKFEDSQERLEKLPELLKRFRQAVLAAAVSGKLTEAWRAEQSPQKVRLNQSHLFEDSFKTAPQSGIPDSWATTTFGSVIKSGPQNGLYKPQTDYGTGSLILRIDNFYEGRINAWSSLKRVSVDSKEAALYGLNNDDIVINRVNSMSHLGKSALVRDLPEPCVFESNMMRIALNTEIANPEYIIHYLNSIPGLTELRKSAKQAVNQASINQTDVKNVVVALPSITEQQEIVRQVNHYFELADQLEARFEQAASLLEQLPQAILAKAFSGQLVSQDPNDEPASALLERLQSGSAAPTKGKRGRKPKAMADAPLFE